MRPLTFEKARHGVNQLTGYLHRATTIGRHPRRQAAPPTPEPAAVTIDRTDDDDEWSRFDALEPRFVELIARLEAIAQRA